MSPPTPARRPLPWLVLAAAALFLTAGCDPEDGFAVDDDSDPGDDDTGDDDSGDDDVSGDDDDSADDDTGDDDSGDGVQVSSEDGWASVCAGEAHTCGQRQDGTVQCWGANEWDQLVVPEGIFLSISCGATYVCAVRPDGDLVCWGSDIYGQSSPPAGEYTQVSAAWYTTCALRADTGIDCWGYNDWGEGDVPPDSYLAVASGHKHTCGIRADDSSVTCWGWEFFGQLEAPDGTFTALAAGSIHTCGLLDDGELTCWTFLEDVDPGYPLTAVGVGWYQVWGADAHGAVACWGDDWAGQARAPEGSYLRIDGGSAHTCAVRDDHHVVCWGCGSGFDRGQCTPP